jgi:hypothetical protein
MNSLFTFNKKPQSVNQTNQDDPLRDIAYSMDALVPGFYVWMGALKIRIGGCKAESNYPGTINSPVGLALVLPGYRIYTTYAGTYDPEQT